MEYKEILDKLSIPFIKISLIQENNEYTDFQITYINPAMLKWKENVEQEKSIQFRQIYNHFQERWIVFFKEALESKEEVIIRMNSDYLDRFVKVRIIPLDYDCCGCLFEDLTQKEYMKERIEDLKKKIDIIVEKTDAFIFDYYYELHMIHNFPLIVQKYNLPEYIENVPQSLFDLGIAKIEDQEKLEDLFDLNSSQDKNILVEFKFSKELGMKWHRCQIRQYHNNETKQTYGLGILQDVHEEVMAKEEIQDLITTDELTQVHNRHGGMKAVSDVLFEQAHKGHDNNALILFNINDFKQVNLRFGHEYGDLVLRRFAKMLKSFFRKDDIVARFGGDEFFTFLPHVTYDQTKQICKRILERIDIELSSMNVTVSIGVSIDESLDFNDYYHLADQALSHSKQSKTKRYTIFSSTLSKEECL